MGVITFNGQSTEQLGLISQAIPVYEFPKKNYTYTHIPGRNGDLVMDSRSYENVERTYYLACIYANNTVFRDNAAMIISWLMGAKGYCRLEDSYEPDVYRMASYVNNGSLTDIYETATTLNVTFNCKPQRYLKSGDVEVNIASLDPNPTIYDALPLIKFKPTAVGTLTITVGNYVVEVDVVESMVNKDNYIDSEIQHCYMEGNISINEHVTLSEFPVLKAGTTSITFTGVNCSTKTIKPRWWKL